MVQVTRNDIMFKPKGRADGDLVSSFSDVLEERGLDLKSQEAALRLGLDIVVATPGRLIDHLHNSPSFSLVDVEVLVLDEADRMLDDQFAEQMKEIIRLCSKSRQTMLFSATMTDEIEDLIKMSLDKPARLFINENTETATNLRQEFIRVREGREGDREAVVAALVTRTFVDHTIVFVKTKRDSERMNVLLGLLGVKVGQLHGGLTQAQRIHALTEFKAEQLDVLVCTDLASRGLDIEGVLTVINMHMPMSIKPYVHRVGRTARAGKSGRSISLIGEDDRKLLKLIYKQNKGKSLKIRNITGDVLTAYSERIKNLEQSVTKVQQEEKEEKAQRQAMDALSKVEGKLNNKPDEREGRVWFQTNIEKAAEKRKLKKAQKMLKQKQKEAAKTPEERSIQNTMSYQVRRAKKEKRPKRLRAVEDDVPTRGVRKGRVIKKKKSSFLGALTKVDKKSVKNIRYGPGDKDFHKAKKGMKAKGALKGPRM
ncbi:unnamed protein product [Bursaphelenchus okinawaensis]|uniref:RNA helicase n=1 Tax=Bursaphelenchus okinawaensis TaxID=465554 RepID=A0A811JSQ8_9BILA|nr:unnamed protein product [Bursaphelenchus okinawaensis]CAG9081958.1 unnamed protein product [Bursaphelenchus okinawaensis]